MNKKTLDQAIKGSLIEINQLPQDHQRLQLLRFGIGEGERVFCLQNLPGGTIILQKRRQEIAIGADLAKCIYITELSWYTDENRNKHGDLCKAGK